jgi:hypothetical protein
VRVSPRHLALVLETSESDMLCAKECISGSGTDDINIWELLTCVAATSTRLSLRTKLCFFFRMWDVDNDRKLHVAEMAVLLRTLTYSIAYYCRCEPSLLPEASSFVKYALRTFKPMTSEETFVAWAMRHRLLKNTLAAFNSAGSGAVDLLDFVLDGPKVNTLTFTKTTTGRKSIQRKESTASIGSNFDSTRSFSDRLGSDVSDSGSEPDSPKMILPPVNKRSTAAANNFALPVVGECHEEDEHEEEEDGDDASQILPKIQKVFKFTDNAPANLPSQETLLGRIRLLEAAASNADVRHECSLHDDPGHCRLLSKSEVLLANRIWMFLKENRDMQVAALPELLGRLKLLVNKHDSILVLTEHRNIFYLMDVNRNRVLRDCVKRIRRGLRVTFLEFLESLCPCASDARIQVFDFWHLQLHWCQEEASQKIFKAWRRDFEATKPASEIKTVRDDLFSSSDNMKDLILTIDDLVVGNIVTEEVAVETVQSHDLTMETELNENKFVHAFCRGDGLRTSWGSSFEELMRKKFGRLAAQLQKVRSDRKQAEEMRLPSKESSLSESWENGFPLDELVGSADLVEAFDLTDSYDLKEHFFSECEEDQAELSSGRTSFKKLL